MSKIGNRLWQVLIIFFSALWTLGWTWPTEWRGRGPSTPSPSRPPSDTGTVTGARKSSTAYVLRSVKLIKRSILVTHLTAKLESCGKNQVNKNKNVLKEAIHSSPINCFFRLPLTVAVCGITWRRSMSTTAEPSRGRPRRGSDTSETLKSEWEIFSFLKSENVPLCHINYSIRRLKGFWYKRTGQQFSHDNVSRRA